MSRRHPFLGQFFVCTTSGTTGHPGFSHDPFPGSLPGLHLRSIWPAVGRAAGHGPPPAALGGRGGHRRTLRRGRLGAMAAQAQPVAPARVPGIPGATAARGARSGPQRLRPLGHHRLPECPSPARRGASGRPVSGAGGGGAGRRVLRAGGADPHHRGVRGALHDAYAASEFTPIALECRRGWLHVNSDWAILEPVDADYRPAPPGEPSHTVLLTNLANLRTAAHPLRPRRLRAGQVRPLRVRQPVARHPGRGAAVTTSSRSVPPTEPPSGSFRSRSDRSSTKRRGCTAASWSRRDRRPSGSGSTRNPGPMPRRCGPRRPRSCWTTSPGWNWGTSTSSVRTSRRNRAARAGSSGR